MKGLWVTNEQSLYLLPALVYHNLGRNCQRWYYSCCQQCCIVVFSSQSPSPRNARFGKQYCISEAALGDTIDSGVLSSNKSSSQEACAKKHAGMVLNCILLYSDSVLLKHFTSFLFIYSLTSIPRLWYHPDDPEEAKGSEEDRWIV